MKGRFNMNDDKENITAINSKIKKYAIALGSSALILAVVALASTSVNDLDAKESTTSAVTDEQEVEAKVTNEPDTREYETIVVPATEVTTVPVVVSTEAVSETVKTSIAPVSYILPLGTDTGSDYSCGVPVYNDVMGDWRTHDGVDFNGDYGDGVKSIADGIVKNIESDALYGTIITVDHGGGVVASYCGTDPADDIIKGVIVSQGQKLGTVSEIPCEADAEFPHVHLEIRVDGQLCDPLEVMGYYE